MSCGDCVDPGMFSQPVRFERPVLTYDAEGGHDTAWTLVYKCFAKIASKSSGGGMSRPYKFMRLYPEMTELITIRYVASVTLDATLRIAFRNRHYEIIGVISPNEEQTLIEIPVKLYRANGTPG